MGALLGFFNPPPKNGKNLFSTFLRCFNGFGWEKIQKKIWQKFFLKIFICGRGIGTFRFFLIPPEKNGENLFPTFLRCFNGFGREKNSRNFFLIFSFSGA